ncbi:hypothetical protein [Hwanghaeella sp.]|uniref:hypothetical protein n=1 Tax=Hwanghaeella sp. TaxID=2605943 RepID=UPI003CCC00EF
MVVLRIVQWLFFLLAFVFLGLGIWLWLAGEDITKAAGALWYALDVSSLNLAQVIVQRHLHLPALWDDAIVPYLLQRPAWESILWLFIGLMVLGGLVSLIARRPRRRHSFRNE